MSEYFRQRFIELLVFDLSNSAAPVVSVQGFVVQAPIAFNSQQHHIPCFGLELQMLSSSTASLSHLLTEGWQPTHSNFSCSLSLSLSLSLSHSLSLSLSLSLSPAVLISLSPFPSCSYSSPSFSSYPKSSLTQLLLFLSPRTQFHSHPVSPSIPLYLSSPLPPPPFSLSLPPSFPSHLSFSHSRSSDTHTHTHSTPL